MGYVTGIELITSLQNPQIKYLVRLRQRRERERENVILVEGARELSRALAAGLVPNTIFICPDLFSPEAREVTAELSPRLQLSNHAFHKVSGRQSPDGVLAVIPTPKSTFPALKSVDTVIVLHGLEKPGNIGAILRTADAAGVAGVIVLGHGADIYSPNVIRSSQGSVFRIPSATLQEDQALKWLEDQGCVRVACTPEASIDYWDVPLTGRIALILGAEHSGLPEDWRSTQLPVRVPMYGAADSLNVATAAALVIYECLRQRREVLEC